MSEASLFAGSTPGHFLAPPASYRRVVVVVCLTGMLATCTPRPEEKSFTARRAELVAAARRYTPLASAIASVLKSGDAKLAQARAAAIERDRRRLAREALAVLEGPIGAPIVEIHATLSRTETRLAELAEVRVEEKELREQIDREREAATATVSEVRKRLTTGPFPTGETELAVELSTLQATIKSTEAGLERWIKTARGRGQANSK